jgi:hypothetical protein
MSEERRRRVAAAAVALEARQHWAYYDGDDRDHWTHPDPVGLNCSSFACRAVMEAELLGEVENLQADAGDMSRYERIEVPSPGDLAVFSRHVPDDELVDAAGSLTSTLLEEEDIQDLLESEYHVMVVVDDGDDPQLVGSCAEAGGSFRCTRSTHPGDWGFEGYVRLPWRPQRRP